MIKLKLSNIKTFTLISISTILLLLILNLVFITTMRYFLREEAMREAKDKSMVILDRNLSIHKYYSKNLKPGLFDVLKDTIDKGNYFDPNWMSSSHAVIKINEYFQQRNNFGYYYKDATFDARNPRNEADSLELAYLLRIKNSPDISEEEGIMQFNGIQYYYLLQKGEMMEKGCLKCHDTPQIAPKGLIDLYGSERSFNRTVGDPISVVSIRVPIEESLKRSSESVFRISIITTTVVVLILLLFLYFLRRWFIGPINRLSIQSVNISNDNTLLGETIKINTSKELSDFIDSFNLMSHKLYENNQNLEEKIQEQTLDLRNKIKELDEVNQTKDKFFSIIAHDLNSPFNSLIGFSKLLGEYARKESFEDIKKISNSLYNTSIQTYNLLQNLLKWSQSQTNNIEFKPQIILLFDLVERVKILLNPNAERKGISIENQVPNNLEFVGDSNMIESILRNLISNGIKFTKEGKVTISALVIKDELEVFVTDTGVGISPEILLDLFTIVKNPSTRGTDNERGTGLGLVLCKDFIEKHNGKVKVLSELGKGSQFSFIIPYKQKLIT